MSVWPRLLTVIAPLLAYRNSSALADPGLSTTVPLSVRAALAPVNAAFGNQARLASDTAPPSVVVPSSMVLPAPVIVVPDPSVPVDRVRVAPESSEKVPVEVKSEL